MKHLMPFRQALAIGAILLCASLSSGFAGEEAVHECFDVNLLGNNSSSAVCALTTVTTTVQTTVAVATQPDTPRNLVLYIVDAAEVLDNLRIIVRGVNQWGFSVSETYDITVASSVGIRLTGEIAFATITTIVYRDAVGYNADTRFILYYGNRFGMYNQIFKGTDVFKLTRATAFAAPVNVAPAGYTVNQYRGTIAPTTHAATDSYHVWSRRSSRKSPALTRDHNLLTE